MTETKVKELLTEQLGSLKGTDTVKITQLINDLNVNLKGYLAWLIQTVGIRRLRSSLSDEVLMKKYKQVCTAEKSALPQHIVNAGELYMKLSNSSLLQDAVLDRLEQMVEKHVLYFLLITLGLNVDKYRAAARKYCMLYPDVAVDLPEPYGTLGKAFVT